MKNYLPRTPIFYISSDGLDIIPPPEISINMIGGKALGLSCIPKEWTLPFLVISADFAKEYFTAKKDDREEILARWVKLIKKTVENYSIDFKEIIVRSSGVKEGLIDRGDYYSVTGTLNSLEQAFFDCFSYLEADEYIEDIHIPFVVQKFCKMYLLKGHLSNERRLYKDARDWVVEYEGVTDGRDSFTINIREWRKSISVDTFSEIGLIAKTQAGLVNALEVVARWTLKLKGRVHFEWIWDGTFLYLVQADEDKEIEGVNPHSIDTTFRGITQKEELSCLDPYPFENAENYPKLNNVGIYHSLDLSVAPLYVLHAPSILNLLQAGKAPEDLYRDLEFLTREPLVIRMDVTSVELEQRQLLPRTDSISNAEDAVQWLIEKSQSEYTKLNPIFIFHNFVPAQAAAFAYAAPGMPTVYIESLWGLPEGLYHYSHDKIQVDTRTRSSDKLSETFLKKWIVRLEKDYKHYIVAPDGENHWSVQRLGTKYGWGKVLDDETSKKIALGSRKIAEKAQKGVSVMWFIGVDPSYGEDGIMPWHHEAYDVDLSRNRGHKRKKTVFDRSFLISSMQDLARLKSIVNEKKSYLRWIRIQPTDSRLLRDKKILKEIGALAKQSKATIYLEGGQLSHAYYQLKKTKASVELALGFKDATQQNFNKLVRDRIPNKIYSSGENVYRAVFTGDDFMYLLKEKLVEEAIEVFDAEEPDELTEELADLLEVIDGICELRGISFDDILAVKNKKAEKVGGFKDGAVLVKTDAIDRAVQSDLSLFDKNDNVSKIVRTELSKIKSKSHKIKTGKDEGIKKDATFFHFSVETPVLRNEWVVTPPSTFIQYLKKNPEAVIKLSAKRNGCTTKLSLKASTPPKNMSLLDYT